MIAISVVMIAKNAEKTIEQSLQTLKDFDEVILYVNNSTDLTKQIASKFLNVKIIDGEFKGFGKTKNSATNEAKNDWILSLDSDELIPSKLFDEIQKLDFSDKYMLGVIKRDNLFYSKKVKYSGWGKDFLVRIYNRKMHSFNDNIVHEFIVQNSDSHLIKLKNSFIHLAVDDINQFLDKIKYYSDLASKDKKSCYILIPIFKAIFAFFKTYFLQFGFLDGYRGLIIAISNANGRFYRYIKRYINCKER